uniref:R3H domain-containing protein n=1 Tax=Peronospora matthiolae TaxID=2874970 RepID=A0AAV1UNP1_9STRA
MPHPDVKLVSAAVEVSDSEESSLCESELELEMAWGEGPIAPLRTEGPATKDGVVEKSTIAGVQQRSCSSRNDGVRAHTPKRRGSESPLAGGSKRLINIHPIRSAGYLSNPNELPLGARKQQRWLNDHHFGNRAASTRLEDLMEHMNIHVEWRSNFEKLAEPQNEDLQAEFRQGGCVPEHHVSHGPRNRRKDKWNDAEQMFTRVDRRARTLILRSLTSLAPFIEAVECVVLHFIQWREVPSELEIAAPLFHMLKHPIELVKVCEKDVRLVMPLLDSAFHRLIIHSVCQFYGVRSRTEANRRLNTKVMVLKSPKTRSLADNLAQISMCDFIRETRLARRNGALASPAGGTDKGYTLEVQSKSSECSEGFCLVEAPQV